MHDHSKPGTPEELVLQHHGVKGMKWGVRKAYEPTGRLGGGAANTQQILERVTRTDNPQFQRVTEAPGSAGLSKKKGLTADQKILLTYGVLGAAAAGYLAYSVYQDNKVYQQSFTPEGLLDAKKKETAEVAKVEGMALPKNWDVNGLQDGPISKRALGDLAGGDPTFELLNKDKLTINTSRGYADILPTAGLASPHAVAQHDSAIRVLEEMRGKYPALRNMNIEVVPMSHVRGITAGNGGAVMCVQAMRAGEARLMYNDLMDPPTPGTIAANKKFLPGLGQKDYVAYHEMGHLLAAARGDIPPTFDLLAAKSGRSALEQNKLFSQWQTVEPLLHKKRFLKHGFTFKELSKLSGYAATEPAEAMAELHGHYAHPEMRKKLTPDQIARAEAMFNEMGGVPA